MEEKINFICDLVELKKPMINIPDNSIYSHAFYSFLDCLISHFLDKYKVDYHVVVEEMKNRRIRNY